MSLFTVMLTYKNTKPQSDGGVQSKLVIQLMKQHLSIKRLCSSLPVPPRTPLGSQHIMVLNYSFFICLGHNFFIFKEDATYESSLHSELSLTQ